MRRSGWSRWMGWIGCMKRQGGKIGVNVPTLKTKAMVRPCLLQPAQNMRSAIFFPYHCGVIYIFNLSTTYLKMSIFTNGRHIFQKGSSGHKQKCTQFPTPFSSTVFHALSHGEIHFVWSVSFENLEMEVFDWLLKNFNQKESGLTTSS